MSTNVEPSEDQCPRPTFGDMLDDLEHQVLRDLGEWKLYRRNKVIIREGEPSEFAFVIVEGWVKISRLSPRKEGTALALRGPGDLVGECVADEQLRTATVTALSEVVGLYVTAEEFTRFLRTHPGAASALRRMERDRRMESERAQMGVMNKNADQRLARLVLELADNFGRIEKDRSGVALEVRLTQRELAQLISVSTSVVERTLADWRERGYVATKPPPLILLDLRQLRRIAGREW